MAAYAQTGRMHPMLAEQPELPRGAELLWADFLSLHSSRAYTGAGPARITYSDMDVYQRVTGACLKPWQIDAIRRADSAWFEVRK